MSIIIITSLNNIKFSSDLLYNIKLNKIIKYKKLNKYNQCSSPLYNSCVKILYDE